MQKEKLDLIVSVLAVSFFVLLLVIAAFLLFRIYLKRKNNLLLEKERMSIQFEQTLLQSKLEIQEQTFHHISQELHDNIGQVLSLVSINLNSLKAPGESARITLMDELLEKVLIDLRNLSHSLDADHIRDNGWHTPVHKLLHHLQQTGKYTTAVKLEDDLPALGNERPIILFRMIQEVINNITKHAKADRIVFEAQKKENGLLITIQDNGKGFDSRDASEGAGLRNLENRAKLINANLSVDSEPGKGTLVTIFIKTEKIE
ncbi:MAG TPA: ATP-binding protein [Chitinophagaceae bacterium]